MPDLLPNETIAAVIPKLFTQVDYGFLPSDFGPTVKVPAAFQIRCWEVKEPAKYLTPEQCEAVAKRKAERQQIRRECVKIPGRLLCLQRPQYRLDQHHSLLRRSG